MDEVTPGKGMRFGSLFAGVGGFDLGLERAGMQCAWQVEIDPFCRQVLAKHWPDVPRYEDVRDVGAGNLAWVDVIAGGFPCQDISNAGKREGIEGERSGLWTEFARIIRELRPRYVIVENVAALLVRGMGTVLGDLATCGYDAEWTMLSACAFGAPHSRPRVFVLAYATGSGCQARSADRLGIVTTGNGQATASPHSALSDPRRAWGRASTVERVADGVPHRVDRLRALGNAVLPQVAEWLGRRIVEAAS